MTKNEKDQWLKTASSKLFISKNYFHHHAFEIINTHKHLKDDLLENLSENEAIQLSKLLDKIR